MKPLRLGFLVSFLCVIATAQNVIPSPATVGQLNNRIYVDGTKYPLTQAGIQQAFTDACAITGGGGPGTDVYLPPMKVVASSGSGQQFLVTCNLHIHGAGDYSTVLQHAAGTSAALPMFRFQPNNTSAQSDIMVEGLQVASTDLHSGGTAFLMDGSNTGMTGPNNFVIRKNLVQGLASGAHFLAFIGNSDPNNPSQMGWNHIVDNTSYSGGIILNNSVTDSNLIEHNVFNSTGGDPCIDATTSGTGASHTTAFANNGGCDGGFFVTHGTIECQILYNQIEQLSASTEPNSTMIDIEGDNFPVNHCNIIGNNIGSNGLASINIRLDHATNTVVEKNVIGIKSVTGTGINLTANSSGTVIDARTNQFIGVGGGAAAMVDASGSNPFSITIPSSTDASPATITDDTAGGIALRPSTGSNFQWVFFNSGALFSPKGAGIGFNGATQGVVQLLSASTQNTSTNSVIIPYNPANPSIMAMTVKSDDASNLSGTRTITMLASGNANTGGHYYLQGFIVCTTADSSGALVTPQVTYTTDGTVQTVTGSSLTLNNAANNQIRFQVPINADPSTAITLTDSVSGTPTAARYATHMWLVRQ